MKRILSRGRGCNGKRNNEERRKEEGAEKKEGWVQKYVRGSDTFFTREEVGVENISLSRHRHTDLLLQHDDNGKLQQSDLGLPSNLAPCTHKKQTLTVRF